MSYCQKLIKTTVGVLIAYGLLNSTIVTGVIFNVGAVSLFTEPENTLVDTPYSTLCGILSLRKS